MNTRRPLLRRMHLTLMEVMIVISIIALTAGFVGINVAQAVREQRFRGEVGRVADLLGLAQDIMLVMDIGTKVIFEEAPSNEGIQVRLETDMPLPSHWRSLFMRQQPPLKAIHRVEFDNEEDSEKEGKLEIKFLSTGLGMSKGTLRLSTSDSDSDLGAFSNYICFPGYPKAIVVKAKADGDPVCDFNAQENELKNVVRLTVEELRGLPSYYQNTEDEEEGIDAKETQTIPESD